MLLSKDGNTLYFLGKVPDMKIKIREEKGSYLAYFLDSRRLVGVNKIGAEILELLFNENKSISDITVDLEKRYKISLSQIKEDVKTFLVQLKKEILPSGFNVIDQEQMNSPLGIELEITTSCNIRCRHCVQDGKHNEVFMSYEKFVEIVDILAGSNVCEISLMGGEPFRHKRIFEMLRYCQKKDLAINIVTNATLIDGKAIREISLIERIMLIVSLDGVQSAHDYIRGVGVFSKVDNALRMLIKEDIAVETMCTLNSYNASKYREILEYCRELDIPCNFNLFKPFTLKHSDLVLDPSQFFKIILDLFKLRRDSDYKIGLSNSAIVAHLLDLPPRNECRATMSGLVIDVEGRMVTCPSLVAAGYYKQKELPSFDRNFLEKWRTHESFKQFRQNGLKECQARSLIFNSSVFGEDPYGIDAFIKYQN